MYVKCIAVTKGRLVSIANIKKFVEPLVARALVGGINDKNRRYR